MSERVEIEIAEADLADLREWAKNSERPVEELLQEALQQYLRYTREDIDELDRRSRGPFHTLEEVRARLAERRSRFRSDAAE